MQCGMSLARSFTFLAVPLFLVACGGGVAGVPDGDENGGGGSGSGASGGHGGGSGSGASGGAAGSSGSAGSSGTGGSSGSSGTGSSSGTTPGTTPPEVVPPSDLELGTTGSVGGAPGSYTATVDSSTSVDGSAAELLASGAGTSDSAWGDTMATRPIDKSYWGKRFKMTAKIKTEGVTQAATLYFEVLSSTNGSYVLDDMLNPTDRSVRGTQDWKQVSLVLDVPTGADYFYFGSMLYGAGKVWVGPITFEEVAKSVPQTPHSFGGTSP
jgi:hypothetical protein